MVHPVQFGVGGPDNRVMKVVLSAGYSISMSLPNPYPYRGVIQRLNTTGVSRGDYPTGTYSPSWAWFDFPEGQTNRVVNVYSNTSGGGSTLAHTQTFVDNNVYTFDPDHPGHWTRAITQHFIGWGYVGMSPGGDVYCRGPYVEDQSGNLVSGSRDPYSVWSPKTLADAITTAGTASYNAAVAAGAGPRNEVISSDGGVIAFEGQTTTQDPYNPPTPQYTRVQYHLGDIIWRGDSTPMYESYSGYAQDRFFAHNLTYTVPQDCIWPETPTPPYLDGMPAEPTPTGSGPWNTWNATWGSAKATWESNWASGQTTLLARKVTWLNKNTTDVLTPFKNGTGTMPAVWDFLIKATAPTSTKTKRSVLMTTGVVDSTVSDTSSNLTAVGTKVSRRVVTFSFTTPPTREDKLEPAVSPVTKTDTIIGPSDDPLYNIITRQYAQVVTGTLTEVVTSYYKLQTGNRVRVIQHSYTDWAQGYDQQAPGTTRALAMLLPTKVVQDYAANTAINHSSMYMLWSGVIQDGYIGDSKFGTINYSETYAGYNPAHPKYDNSLAGFMPDILKVYRRTIPIEYVTSGASYSWNDSGMYIGQKIEIVCIGAVKDDVPLGMFPGAVSAQKIEVFGKVVFEYDYNTGEFIWDRWVYPDSVNSQSKILNYAFVKNAMVKYDNIKWGDVLAGKAAVEAAYTVMENAILACFT